MGLWKRPLPQFRALICLVALVSTFLIKFLLPAGREQPNFRRKTGATTGMSAGDAILQPFQNNSQSNSARVEAASGLTAHSECPDHDCSLSDFELCDKVRNAVARLLNKAHHEQKVNSAIFFSDAFMCIVQTISANEYPQKKTARFFLHPDRVEGSTAWRKDFKQRYDSQAFWLDQALSRINHTTLLSNTHDVARAVYLYNADDACTLPEDIYKALTCLHTTPMFMNGISTDDDALLVPDFYFIESRGFADTKKLLGGGTAKWQEKQAIAFFRGLSTGGVPIPGHLDEVPRLKLAILSGQPEFHSTLDAGVSGIVQAYSNTSVVELEARTLGLIKDFVADSDMAEKYRVLVDIDGNANSWKGSFWKLASNSLTIKVECNFRLWWYAKVQAWVHYVPVRCDLADLLEKITWSLAPENEDTVLRIIEASTRLMNSITFDSSLDEFAPKLRQKFKLCRGKARV